MNFLEKNIEVSVQILLKFAPKGTTYDLLACISTNSRVTHICVDNLTIIGSDNGLSPGRRQAIIWTNAEILLIGH